jgi:hypothetical protein
VRHVIHLIPDGNQQPLTIPISSFQRAMQIWIVLIAISEVTITILPQIAIHVIKPIMTTPQTRIMPQRTFQPPVPFAIQRNRDGNQLPTHSMIPSTFLYIQEATGEPGPYVPNVTQFRIIIACLIVKRVMLMLIKEKIILTPNVMSVIREAREETKSKT